MNDTPNLSLPFTLAQAIVTYLSSRPWNEVNSLLQALKNLTPVEAQNTSKVKDKK